VSEDVQLRLLASGILFRAALRAFPRAPSAQEKMRLHQLAEQSAWGLAPGLLLLAEGRDVDDGIPETPEWRALVQSLVAEGLNTPGA
jgi:hypothetical protein